MTESSAASDSSSVNHQNGLLQKGETFLCIMVMAGIIFKLMNWPMATMCLLVGLSFLSMVYFIGGTFLVNKIAIGESKDGAPKPQKTGKIVGVVGGLVFALASVALLFGIEQWPNWHSLISLAIPASVIIALVGAGFMAKKDNAFGLPLLKRGVVFAAGCFLVLLFHVDIEGGRYGYLKPVFKDIHACAEKGKQECKDDLLSWRDSMSAPTSADPELEALEAEKSIDALVAKYGFEVQFPEGETGPAVLVKVE